MYFKYNDPIARFLFTTSNIGIAVFAITLGSCIPDYISLLKGRMLIKYMTKHTSALKMLIIFIIDVSISTLIAFTALCLLQLGGDGSAKGIFNQTYQGFLVLAGN